MSARPIPFASCPAKDRAAVTRLYFDVDDTLTERGRLPSAAIAALERARAAGLSLVAVTGRSAAWGEALVRLLPLDACIAETGALCFWPRPHGGVEVLHAEPDAEVRATNAEKRRSIAAALLATFPVARLAVDNIGRLYDLAVDLVEDGPRVDDVSAQEMRTFLAERGLTVAQSSVHINAWFGVFDKRAMVDRLLREKDGVGLAEAAATLVYVGDSKNDGSMFAATPLSVGVANVAPHVDALAAVGKAPRWIVDGEGGTGFASVVDLLLAARA